MAKSKAKNRYGSGGAKNGGDDGGKNGGARPLGRRRSAKGVATRTKGRTQIGGIYNPPAPRPPRP